jgi:hypothetical protein
MKSRKSTKSLHSARMEEHAGQEEQEERLYAGLPDKPSLDR